MINYYETIMGKNDDCFIPIFQRRWQEELDSHNIGYSNALQLKSGNRLRPILLAWGYYSQSSTINNDIIADCAVCIELIHKASILLDDLIDNDIARHGVPTFHIEFSQEEAILYAIFLINRSIKRINEIDCAGATLLINTVNDMAIGCLREIQQTDIKIDDVKEIIDFETTRLIQNSFTLGYTLLNKETNRPPIYINNLGKYAGYCFQLLNDLEPFTDLNVNMQYKGGNNHDFNKSRKNIVIAYLYGACNQSERTSIDNASISYNQLMILISKYNINNLVLEEVNNYLNLIKNDISIMEKEAPTNYIIDFKSFIKYMFNICYKKLGITFNYTGFDHG